MTLLLFYMPNNLYRVITLLYSAYRADQRLNMVSSLFPKPGSIVGHLTFFFLPATTNNWAEITQTCMLFMLGRKG